MSTLAKPAEPRQPFRNTTDFPITVWPAAGDSVQGPAYGPPVTVEPGSAYLGPIRGWAIERPRQAA